VVTLLHPRDVPCTDACTRETDCPFWVDSRARATAQGRAAVGQRYHAQLRARLESGLSEDDVAERLSRLGVPRLALQAARAPKDSEALKAARTWWASKGAPSLVLVGEVGLGKTTACAWLALEVGRAWGWNTGSRVTADEAPLVWLDGPRLSQLSRYDVEAAEVLDAAATARLLVVDDAGREGNRPAVEALSDVLTERLDRGRRTALSTNLRGDAFKARYGAPLADRLRAAGHVVGLRGASMRQPTPGHHPTPENLTTGRPGPHKGIPTGGSK